MFCNLVKVTLIMKIAGGVSNLSKLRGEFGVGLGYLLGLSNSPFLFLLFVIYRDLFKIL